MTKLFKKSLFIFRRDLRLEDNIGLIFALEKAHTVIPCFIFNPEQIENNPYRSEACVQFMIESLEDLSTALLAKKAKLHLFYGAPEEIVLKCIKNLSIDSVVFNKDYTPYSIARDNNINKICKKYNVSVDTFDDSLLNAPETTLKSDNKPYSVFTPFYKNAAKSPVPTPLVNHHHNYNSEPISFATTPAIYDKIIAKRTFPSKGGRQKALKILKNINIFSDYSSLRDIPSKNATTHLSPHLKFSTCSIREVYWALANNLGPSSALIRSLYWRDFFTSIAFYFPKVFSGAFHSKFNDLTWSQDKKAFQRWCNGTTGFPIVDAGMRELNETGFMHNRVRMISASFLVKDLHINWQWGEKYFASKLVDYDPAVNNGNWQWAASTGCDAQPYFRIFSPWLQAKRFDPDCIYIKQWIPELEPLSAQAILNWDMEKHHKEYSAYPPPMLDHSKESKAAIASYKKLSIESDLE